MSLLSVIAESNLTAPPATFKIGLNFRATAGYVTDGTNETYVVSDMYPVTRGGVTFGWNGAINTRDRASAQGKLGGCHYVANNTSGRRFRLDLPSAGNYRIRIASGDPGSNNYSGGTIKDNATTLIAVSAGVAGSFGTNQFRDASDVTRTSAALWVANNVAVDVTFASTILYWECPNYGAPCCISHIYVEKLP